MDSKLLILIRTKRYKNPFFKANVFCNLLFTGQNVKELSNLHSQLLKLGLVDGPSGLNCELLETLNQPFNLPLDVKNGHDDLTSESRGQFLPHCQNIFSSLPSDILGSEGPVVFGAGPQKDTVTQNIFIHWQRPINQLLGVSEIPELRGNALGGTRPTACGA